MKILSIITQKPSSTGSGIYLTEILKSYRHLGEEQAVICGVTKEDKLPDIPSVEFFPVYYESEELPGRLIPLPSVISAGCGLAWSTALENKELTLTACKDEGLEPSAVHEILF